MDPVEEGGRFGAIEVADVGAEPEDQAPFIAALLEVLEAVGVVAGDGEDFEVVELFNQRLRTFFESKSRYVDRYEAQMAVAFDQGLHQQARLHSVAAAELDETDLLWKQRGDLGGALIQDGMFGAGDVVLRQLADLFEQGRAFLVVEVAARQALGRRGQTFFYILGKIDVVLSMCGGDQRDGGGEGGLLYGELSDDGKPFYSTGLRRNPLGTNSRSDKSNNHWTTRASNAAGMAPSSINPLSARRNPVMIG